MFFLVQSADHRSGLTGASPAVNISKAGGAFAAAAGTVSEVSSGWYKIFLSGNDTNTVGNLAFHITAASADPTDFAIDEVRATIFSDALLDAGGNVSVTSAFKKNVTLNGLMFPMTNSSSHQLQTGLTVSAQISKDGGSLTATANSPTEVGGGLYAINLQSAEMNANKITLIFSAAGADVRILEFGTQP
jgi:hypothetical protein